MANILGFVKWKEQTRLFTETVDKIEELIQNEGLDVAHRAIAAVMSDQFDKIWMKGWKATSCGLVRDMLTPKLNDLPKINGIYVDHVSGWKNKETGEEAIMLEPYGISSEDLKRLIAQCEKSNLDFFISGNSRHFFGWTINILIRRKEAI